MNVHHAHGDPSGPNDPSSILFSRKLREHVTKSVTQNDTRFNTDFEHDFQKLREDVTRSVSPNLTDLKDDLTEFNAVCDEVSEIIKIIIFGI